MSEHDQAILIKINVNLIFILITFGWDQMNTVLLLVLLKVNLLFEKTAFTD